MIEIDKKNGTIRIVEQLSFEANVLPIIERMKEYLEDEIENIDDEDDVNDIKKFLNTTEFTPEQVASCLQEIVNYYERADYESARSIFEEPIIEGGVKDWIEMEFNVLCDY